jgi:uncharacterized membrane protein
VGSPEVAEMAQLLENTFRAVTVARDSWLQGSIGMVAMQGTLRTQAQISANYTAMTGAAPAGSCASTRTRRTQP